MEASGRSVASDERIVSARCHRRRRRDWFLDEVAGRVLRDHRHKHRGFVKVHMAVDVRTLDVLAVVVTDDAVDDNRAFSELVE